MFFQEEVKPRISDFDRNGSFAYEAMLQVLETAGSHHSDRVHDHVIAGSQSGIAWILMEWRIKIHSLPSSTDMLKITTWVRGKIRKQGQMKKVLKIVLILAVILIVLGREAQRHRRIWAYPS